MPINDEMFWCVADLTGRFVDRVHWREWFRAVYRSHDDSRAARLVKTIVWANNRASWRVSEALAREVLEWCVSLPGWETPDFTANKTALYIHDLRQSPAFYARYFFDNVPAWPEELDEAANG